MADWHSDNLHVFVGGSTRSGKTVLANQIHAENDRVSVFFHKSAQDVENIRGVEVGNTREMMHALSNGAQCVNFYWSDPDDWSGDDELKKAVDALFEVADRSPNTSYQLIVDEVHEHIGNQPAEGNRIMRLCKTGAGSDLSGVLLSQNQQNISNLVLSQCDWHVWVGAPSTRDRSYLSDYGYPVTNLDDLGVGEFVVMSNKGGVVEEGRSDPAYSD